MKKPVFGYVSIILLGSCVFAPGLHAAGGQALDNWTQQTLRSIELSGTDPLQQIMQDSMQQMIDDSLRLPQPQLRMPIRLTDDLPVGRVEYINGNSVRNAPNRHQLPQSSLPASSIKLG